MSHGEPAPSARAGVAPAASASDAAQQADTSAACPDGMVLVSGRYCPQVEQRCLEHHPEYIHEQQRIAKLKAAGQAVHSTVSERCLRYQVPSRCLSAKRRPMRYCIDRYEWPNEQGELPRPLSSWTDARRSCRQVGKRLCTVAEFNFACEGEQMLPYTYGYERDATKCSIDKPYIRRIHNLKRFDNCMKDERCRAEFARLDQREPAGSRPGCVSPFGVYDLNGNINEWVRRPSQTAPDRSGLKSGWWGPVRCRCRPTVGFHKENDYGYEVGFRCCRDASSGR